MFSTLSADSCRRSRPSDRRCALWTSYRRSASASHRACWHGNLLNSYLWSIHYVRIVAITFSKFADGVNEVAKEWHISWFSSQCSKQLSTENFHYWSPYSKFVLKLFLINILQLDYKRIGNWHRNTSSGLSSQTCCNLHIGYTIANFVKEIIQTILTARQLHSFRKGMAGESKKIFAGNRKVDVRSASC